MNKAIETPETEAMRSSGISVPPRALQRTAGGAAGLLALGGSGAALAARSGRPPNILFILADDLGYADLSCYGRRDYRTPHLDGLAAQGLRLTQGYSNSSVCSPTRVALITGRYQYRLPAGLEEVISPTRNVGLPSGHPTLPSLLRGQGYRTALVGKWHIGDPPLPGPLEFGYDRFFGTRAGGADYFDHDLKFGDMTYGGLYEGDRKIERHGYLTDLLTDRAIQEIGDGSEKRPFFLSLHYTSPHWPWQAPGDADQRRTLTSPLDPDHGSIAKYAEMVRNLDDNVGRVLAALAATGQADDTIVVFTSDNGGERFSDMWPFIGAKTELLEGGIRVPLLLRWPGQLAAGAVSDQVMASMDFLPTLLAAAGGKPDPAYPSDGIDLLPVLAGAASATPRTLFWRHKAGDQAAVRDGDWKYLRIGGREHLFNLAEDARERADKSKLFPDRFDRLKSAFETWNRSMLPYEDATISHSAKYNDHWADRY